MTKFKTVKIKGFVPLAGTPRRLEVHISYSCTQHCVFCSEASRLKNFSGHHFPPAELAALLKEKRALGFSHVTFTGGEPTLLAYLPQMLAIAKKLGYTTYITSNGQLLREQTIFDKVVENLDELCLSFHSADAETQDALSRSPGGAHKLAQTLELLRRSKKDIFLLTNTVVTRQNLRELPAIIKCAAKTGKLRHCLFSYPAPEGRGFKNFGELAVDFKKLHAEIPALARTARNCGATLRFFGVPACVLGKYAALANDRYFSPRVTIERAMRGGNISRREITTAAPVRRRVYLPCCARCAQVSRCGGIFRAYLDKFGKAGITPLRRPLPKV